MEERKGYISQTTGRRRWRAPDVIRGFRWDREGVHLPVGFIIAGLLWAGMTHYAYITFAFFLAYEISEGWRIRDGAFRDLGAAMVGFLIVTAIVFGMKVFG